MSREDVLWEADEVEAGRLSLYDCCYPNEVEDELGGDFDSDGYYIRPSPNWDYMNDRVDYSDNNEGKSDNHECCCFVFLIFLFVLFVLFLF